MNSLRRLQPTAALVICLGAGYAAVSVGFSGTGAHERLVSRAAETRKQALLAALSKRLKKQSKESQPDHPARELTPVQNQPATEHAAATTSSSTLAIPVELETLLGDAAFYVVTGPDVHLTELARDRMRLALQQRGSANMAGASSAQPPPARLFVPSDCAFGTGCLSSLVENQLLSRQVPPKVHDESEKQLQSPGGWQLFAAVEDFWNLLVLQAARPFLDPGQLDHVALWALEHALEALPISAYKSAPPSPWAAVGTEDMTAGVDSLLNESEAATGAGALLEEIGRQVLREERSDSHHIGGESFGRAPSSFVLEIVSSVPRDDSSREKGSSSEVGAEGESPTLCGKTVRWAWRLANRGLGNVIVSSSSPWILAELQKALETKPEADSYASPEGEGYSGDGAIEGVAADGDGGPLGAASEVMVVRVALPSAVEREQAVTAVAEELGVDRDFSSRDVSMLADLTRGRRAGLINILKRVQTSPMASVAVHCRAAVNDQALALAESWGLLSHDTSFEAVEDRDLQVEERAALWEALHALSVPPVSVGAAVASVPVPPEGGLPPSELLRACELDPATLLRLIRKGWLEVTPADSSTRSGTVLRDPEPLAESSPALPSLQDQHGIAPSSQRLRLSQARPPVRVLSASVPAESLSHLRQSYVGANPLQLAAFRRLVDATTPPSKNPKRDIDSFLIGGGIGGPTSRTDWVPDGWGSAHAPETVSKLEMAGGDDQGEGTGRRARGSHPITDAWRARQLERAGCLIEASVLRRQIDREEEKLAEDGETLSLLWTELGSVRKDLERDGRGDASEGEWAEVQLELIRQARGERSVVADAQEMRARRERVEKTRRVIEGLKRRAESIPPPFPKQRSPRETPREASAPPLKETRDLEVTSRFGVERRRLFSAEDCVLRDAEGGIRLMPL
ncbi:unnamed protein product, partial [Ascophyllum nodosum]